MELATGQAVDRYVVEGILGEGGMAIVYLCKHAQLGTKHALKVLTMSSRAIRERLVQEGQVQASLRHTNIVAVTDIIVLNGAPGLVMEYIEGPSLDELLNQQSLTYDQADVLVEGLLAGVAHAHAQGLVHRDLKPANIMLALDGGELVPKVMDFGLAKLIEGDPDRKAATRTGSTMGTPQYMSPEQVEDSKNVDHRTDVFACGAILYEMVTGHRAFAGDSLYKIFGAVAEGQYRNPRELRADLPDRMEAAILGALTPDKDARIQSVPELIRVWKGESSHAGAVPVEPVGPFSAEFFDSVRSMTSEAAPSTPDPTFAMDAGVHDVSVESLFQGAPPTAAAAPPEPVAAPLPPPQLVPPPPVDRNAGIPASSVVKGTAVVMGGGAMVMGLGLLGVLLVMGGGVAAYVMMSPNGAPPAPTIVEPVEPNVAEPPEPVVPDTPAVPVPSPTQRPGPVASTQPVAEPTTTVTKPVDDPGPPEPVEPTEPDPAEPTVEPTGTTPADLTSAKAGKRLDAVADNEMNGSLTGTFVSMARTDPDRDVAVRAWQAIIRQYRNRTGDRAAQEQLIIEAIRTGVFSQSEAATTYGKGGTDPSVLVPLLESGGLRARNSAITAVVAIGRRHDTAAAKRVLQDQLTRAKGPMRLRLEAAVAQL